MTAWTRCRRALLVAVLAVLAAGLAAVAVGAAPTRARAQSYARAVNLRAADLPGFAATSSRTTPADQRFGAQLARCAGGANPGLALVNADSPDFTMASAGGIAEQDASSNVTVLPSAHLAAKDLAAIRSARGRVCLVRFVGRRLRAMKLPAGVTFGPVSVASAGQPAPGASGSFGVRLRVTANVRGVRIPFYFDADGFTRGAVEVGLTTFGAAKPFPATTQRRLFSTLLGRAMATRL